MNLLLKLTIALSLIFSPIGLSTQYWDRTFHEVFWHLNVGVESLTGEVYMLGYNEFPESTVRILKVDRYGHEVWQKQFTDYFTDEYVWIHYKRIAATADGNVVFISSETSGSNVVKINADGDVLWSTFIDNVQGATVIEDTNSKIVFFGPQDNQIVIMKLDQNGDILTQKNILDNVAPYIFTNPNPLPICLVDAYPDGTLGLIVQYDTEPAPSNNYRPFLIKLDNNDDIEWSNELLPSFRIQLIVTSDGSTISFRQENGFWQATKHDISGNFIWEKQTVELFSGAFKSTDDGGFLIANVVDAFPNTDRFLTKFDLDGNEVWQRNYGPYYESDESGSYFSSIHANIDGGYTLFGGQEDSGYFDAFIIRTDAFGFSTTNLISGNIISDADLDCTHSAGDSPLVNWYIESDKYGQKEITNSDGDGLYNFHIDTGIYTLNVFPPNPYWEPCFTDVEVPSLNVFDTSTVDMPIQASVACPFMEVDLTTPFLRRCFESTYHVNYCNTGTVTAEPAYIEITLDPFLTYLGSSIPLSNQNGDTLTFQLGMVAIGECGSFTFEVEVSCDAELGQTHCTEAHIFPDSLCLPSSTWSGAQIEVQGACVNDTIFFNVQNIGSDPMSELLPFLVIEDDVILLQGDIPILQPMQSEEYHYVATGSTYRFEANQEPNFPGGNSNPSATVEACGSGGFSFGFFNQFPQDDESPVLDIDCRENIGSYDPNDKQGFPTGWGTEHFIHQNTDLEYLIRFQNTGTDTAFNVIIRDTLSPFLDPASIRLGASSHPFEFRLSGVGILEFAFPDILLPDSLANLEGSQGFVKFKVAQRLYVPLGSVIENSAAIYFDFNAPVITNTTWHTVGEDLLNAVFEISPHGHPDVQVKVVPNPFSEKAILEITGAEMPGENTLSLFDAAGRLLLSQKFKGEKTELDGKGLRPGIYFFKIENASGKRVTGKAVVFKK